MAYVPDRGDIIWLDFDPSAGKEIKGHHPAYVLSHKLLAHASGLAILAPITSTVRGSGFEVALDDKLKTTGVVLVHQLGSVDFSVRNIKYIESATASMILKISAIAQVIVR